MTVCESQNPIFEGNSDFSDFLVNPRHWGKTKVQAIKLFRSQVRVAKVAKTIIGHRRQKKAMARPFMETNSTAADLQLVPVMGRGWREQ